MRKRAMVSTANIQHQDASSDVLLLGAGAQGLMLLPSAAEGLKLVKRRAKKDSFGSARARFFDSDDKGVPVFGYGWVCWAGSAATFNTVQSDWQQQSRVAQI